MLDEVIGTMMIAEMLRIYLTIGPAFVPVLKFYLSFRKLKAQSADRQKDVNILFSCVRGSLEGLVDQGFNGRVQNALNELNDYVDEKAATRIGG